ncbi:hypothetical protein [Phaeobacter inhibens]|uniref:hypothetical protein n=1 Tax=Phaeobacter inhibens TaxID=221822 RepID=UPI000C9BD86B|nr:hypothetical protein [Phaeobacter inhibens]AUQ62336.1 hypothetical protein PhaeoP51_01341 [Phaeobacter inhibens]AUQ91342.1 hypothetical protein PhaeoP24_02752 [Phaeobacter inhibens]
MRLRTRLSEELKARLIATLPEAVETVWDHVAVVVMVEQLKFTSAGGLEGDWERRTQFEGVVRAELRADAIDSLEVEPLITNLVADPVFLNFEPEPEPEVDQISEKARIVLAEWRDTIRDQDVASALRFTVTGTIAAYHGPAIRPELLVGQAPDIGPGNEDAYVASIGGDA